MLEEKHNGKVISFINMKGGVGKTTLCREIGYTLNKEHNKSILFIDIDPQANLTQSLYERFNILPKNLYNNLSPEEKQKQEYKTNNATISKLFDDNKILPDKNDIIVDLKSNPRISLIPGDLQTVFLERNGSTSTENSLDKFIDRRKILNDFDYVFIDCPPTYSFYTTTAFNASDYYIVPVGIDPYSILGIDLLEQVVKQIQDDNFRRYDNKPLKNMGIIFNPINYTSSVTGKRQFNNQKRTIKKSNQLKKYNLFYFDEPFNYNSKYKEALDYFAIDSNDKKHNSNIKEITEEFIDRIEYLNKNAREGMKNE